MENYERKIIIPTKSTACNSIHTSMIFVPKSHNYNLLWGWKGYDTAYPCKECSYYKIARKLELGCTMIFMLTFVIFCIIMFTEKPSY